MAAEVVSNAYLFCVLKGLHRAPGQDLPGQCGVVDARHISALVTPERCLGLPVIAAQLQGIPVIAVEDAENVMKNDLGVPTVRNYAEAAGVLMAMREGVSLESALR